MIKLSKPPRLNGQSCDVTRGQIRQYFTETWDVYESLFSLIVDEQGFYERAESLRHPLIFYFGHTAVFFINKLVLGKYLGRRIDHHIESTCAVGVDEMSWDDLNPNNYQWPTVTQVKQYRDTVRKTVLDLIDEMPLTLPITQDSLAWVILMGIEHERIHLETSSVIIRMLDLKYLQPSSQWAPCDTDGHLAPDNSLVAFSETEITLGKPEANDTYGWDNEYGKLDVTVSEFEASKMLVSNQEYMAFVEAGGYQEPRWWTEEGRAWLDYTKARMPRFWYLKDNEYFQRNLCSITPLPLSWPVEVNYLEAKAFCQWKTESQGIFVRLPVEAEWQVLRDTLKTDLGEWDVAPGNINLEGFASSCPVDRHKQGDLFDIIGNVWQWTESPVDGYPGFKVHPLYDDFSTPTFDGKHNLIKGGSWISTGNEATRDSRYAFRRHFFQHAGFRYVVSQEPTTPITPVNEYETQPDISQLLYHHFSGSAISGHGHIHKEFEYLASLVNEHVNENNKVLDLGCGGGRLSFELAKSFPHVDGIDFTARHIQHCLQLKETGCIRFAVPQLGELLDYHEVELSEYIDPALAKNVHFIQGDGHNLKPQFTGYDAIVCHDVLEHAYAPKQLLDCLVGRLNTDGILVLGSCYQWHVNDNRDVWLGGYKDNGENVDTLQHIQELYSEQLQLIRCEPVVREWRENQRSRRLTDMEVSVWKKRH